MSSEIAIKVENLSKCYFIYNHPRDRLKQFILPRLQRIVKRTSKSYYREFWALRNVSFQINKGETIGIIGCNGSGKSTLLQIICGTLNPTSGSVQTNGRIAAMLELGSGFNLEFSGRENIYMNGALLGLSIEEINDRYNDIVAFADIGEFIEQPVKTYSNGMFVRLAFAVQANVDPEILIVDEALAVGDAHFVHRCMLRFHELKRKGTTILLVSHDASSVKRLCDRALWLNRGHLSLLGNVIAVVDEYLQDLFGIKTKNKIQQTISLNSEINTAKHSQKLSEKVQFGDGRFGNRKLEIIKMILTDKNGVETYSVLWNKKIRLLLGVKNNSISKGTFFGCGYIVRDSKGIEIASWTSTWIESAGTIVPEQGESFSVLIEIEIPMIHPGHYSLTPTVSSIDEAGEEVIQDRILNAILFEVTTNQKIYTPFRFQTKFYLGE
jgi:lipopolysaccharide transport system ATP-binding protein